MSCSEPSLSLKTIQYLLCAINFIFAVTGVLAINVGLTIFDIRNNFKYFFNGSYTSPAYIMISLGIAILVISFLGCYGALKKSTAMILSFAFILTIVLILEFAVAILAYFLQDQVINFVASRTDDMMWDYERDSRSASAIDYIQKTMECCGINGPEDWSYLVTEDNGRFEIPATCNRVSLYPQDRILFEQGCLSRFAAIINESSIMISSSALSLAILQAYCIICAVTLGRAIRKQKSKILRRSWELKDNIISGYQPLGKTDPFSTYPVVFMPTSEPLRTTMIS